MRSSRVAVVEEITDHLLAGHLGDRPRRIGVDGITAAGKTTLRPSHRPAGRPARRRPVRWPGAAEEIYRTRYHAACALYATDVDPARRAGILIDNNDLDHPVLRRIGGRR